MGIIKGDDEVSGGLCLCILQVNSSIFAVNSSISGHNSGNNSYDSKSSYYTVKCLQLNKVQNIYLKNQDPKFPKIQSKLLTKCSPLKPNDE